LWAVARQLYPQEEAQLKTRMKVHQKRLLDKGKIEKLAELIDIAESSKAGSPALSTGKILRPASILGPFDVTGITPRILETKNAVDLGAYEQQSRRG
jgi:hypothetical protein